MAGSGTAHLRTTGETLLRAENLVVEFPAGHQNFSGEMAAELATLVESEQIRVLDLLIIEKAEDGLHVHTSVAGRDEVFAADLVVHGAGRIPAIDALDLDKANIRAGKAGITVNEFLQSVSNPAAHRWRRCAASRDP